MRTYDPNAGQWTTPDAYAGDVHDPMTQKPFMWNRNNPYVYADPSGYDALHDVFVKIQDLLATVFPTVSVNVSPALQRDLQARVTRTNNAIANNLKPSDVRAAINEAKGIPTLGTQGRSFDHVAEVQNAVNNINKTLGPGLGKWKLNTVIHRAI